MSVVDDLRKLLQDIVTPDFKALEERIGALDKKVDLSSSALSEKIDINRDLLLAEMKAMQASLETSIAKLTHSLDLERRVTKIENDRALERKDTPPEQRVA